MGNTASIEVSMDALEAFIGLYKKPALLEAHSGTRWEELGNIASMICRARDRMV